MSKQIVDLGGIWGHSSTVGGKHYVIFGSDISVENTEAALDAVNVSYKRLQGVWKGVSEPSWIIAWDDLVGLEEAQVVFDDILRNQESLLQLGPCNSRDEREAILVWRKGFRLQYIGLFKEVHPSIAQSSDSYTYDPTTNKWYVAVK